MQRGNCLLGRPQIGFSRQLVKAQFFLQLAFNGLFQHQPSVGLIAKLAKRRLAASLERINALWKPTRGYAKDKVIDLLFPLVFRLISYEAACGAG
jgi:hypothetical protein